MRGWCFRSSGALKPASWWQGARLSRDTIVTMPMQGFVAAAVVVALLPIAWLDMWRRVLIVATALLLAVNAADQATAQLAYFPRLGMVVALAVVTWTSQPRLGVSASLTGLSAWFIRALWMMPAVTGVSTLWSMDPVETAAQTVMLTCLVVIIQGGLTRRWSTPEDVLDDLTGPFWLITASFVLSLVAFWTGQPGATGYTGRMQGLFNNPNVVGMLTVLTLPLAWALFRQTRSWLYPVAGVISAVALLLCGSRTPIVAMAIALVWFTLRSPLRTAAPVLHAGALAGTAYLFAIFVFRAPLPLPDLQEGTLARFAQNEGGTALNFRDVIWEVSLDLWAQHPLGGLGYGAAPGVLTSDLTFSTYGFTIPSVHNGYLQWFIETGLLGLLPLLALLCVTVAAVYQVPAASIAGPMAVMAVAGLLLQVTESATFGTGQPFPYLFWACVAACTLTASRRVPHPTADRTQTTRSHHVDAHSAAGSHRIPLHRRSAISVR